MPHPFVAAMALWSVCHPASPDVNLNVVADRPCSDGSVVLSPGTSTATWYNCKLSVMTYCLQCPVLLLLGTMYYPLYIREVPCTAGEYFIAILQVVFAGIHSHTIQYRCCTLYLAVSRSAHHAARVDPAVCFFLLLLQADSPQIPRYQRHSPPFVTGFCSLHYAPACHNQRQDRPRPLAFSVCSPFLLACFALLA
jgi:hypothetical protein